MKAKLSGSDKALNKKQQAALQNLEDAFVGMVREGYKAGLDASWILLALWRASDRVEGLPPLSELIAAPSPSLTPERASAIVKRAPSQKKSR